MNDVLLKKWAETRQAHYSAFCVAPGNWLMLLFTMYLHFFKIGRKINHFSWDSFNFERFFISINDFSCFYMSLWLVLQESNPCFNRNLIFFLFDFCLYTSLWYKRGKSNLFSIIAMQIIAPSTPQTLSEEWYSSHQERDRGQVNVLICAAPCCPSGHGRPLSRFSYWLQLRLSRLGDIQAWHCSHCSLSS